MKIPAYDHTKREWDDLKTFHNHLGGPFYVLETGEVIIKRISDHQADRTYHTLNVTILSTNKRKRGERLPKAFSEFYEPQTGERVDPSWLIGSDQYLLIDHCWGGVNGVSAQIYHAPDYIRKMGCVGYSGGARNAEGELTDTLITGVFVLRKPKKWTRAEREHISSIVAASKAWTHLSSEVDMRSGREHVRYNGNWVEDKRVDPHLFFSKYEKNKPIPFTDIPPVMRINIARFPLEKAYEVEMVSHLKHVPSKE